MKRLVLFLIVCLLYPSAVLGINLDITSEHIYLYNLDRNEVIYESKSKEQISVASLTKILTAWVAIENIDNLNATVTISYKDFEGLQSQNASLTGFQVGEVVTYKDLLYGLMLPSGADAGLALARNISGSEEEFVKLMNKKLKDLGLKNSNFVNTHGLDVADQYSSAEDMGIILTHALKNNDFKLLFEAPLYVSSNGKHTWGSFLISMSNRHGIDTSYILGSKAGYTWKAGLCLASNTTHDGDTYILITANADYLTGMHWQIMDTNAIYRYFFGNYSYRNLITNGEKLFSMDDNNGNQLELLATKTVEKFIAIDAEITTKYNGPEKLPKGTKPGDKLGTYEVYVDGVLAASEEVIMPGKIVEKKQNIFIKIISFIFNLVIWVVVRLVIIFILAVILFRLKIKIKRMIRRRKKLKHKKTIR